MNMFFQIEAPCYSKPRMILVCYTIIVASYLHISGCATTKINVPKNAKIAALLVFGDSVVDTGNNNYIPSLWKANFSPYGRDFKGGLATGRYSNGKVPSDLIAEAFGIKEFVPPYLDPTLQISDLLTGVSFASGASGYDPESAELANALNLDDQLNLFRSYINKLKTRVGEKRTQTIISQSFYLISAGSNDIMNSYFATPFRRLHYDVSSYTDLMVKWASAFIQELYSLGARMIYVSSLPPCGCLPAQRTIGGSLLRQCAQNQNQAALLFNNKLSSELDSLNQKLPESTIAYLDIYNPLLNLVTNPSKYGFEVADRGCCGTGIIEVSILCTQWDVGTCTDDSKYIFWDSFHPTEAAYKVIVHDVMEKLFS